MLANTIEPMLCTTDIVDGPESYVGQSGMEEPLNIAPLPITGAAAAEGCGLEITADHIDGVISQTIADLGYEHRFQGLRHVVSILVQLVRGNAAKLRVALALLCRRIPQPYIRDEDRPVEAGIPSRLRRTLVAFLEQLEDPAPEWPNHDFVNFDTVVPHCGPLSPLSINIMQFLENGDYDVPDVDSVDDAERLVPIHPSTANTTSLALPPLSGTNVVTRGAADDVLQQGPMPAECPVPAQHSTEHTTSSASSPAATITTTGGFTHDAALPREPMAVPSIEVHDSPVPPQLPAQESDADVADRVDTGTTKPPTPASSSTPSSPAKKRRKSQQDPFQRPLKDFLG